MEPLQSQEVYRETWYRWVILTLFVLVLAAGGITNTTCSAITDQVSNIYDVSVIWVQMNTMIYEIAYITLVFPCNYFADTYELGLSMKVSAGLTLVGAVLRLAGQWSFWPILIGNGLVAIGVVIGGGCTAKVAAFWFRPEWRTNATMIASLANNIGAAVGVFIPSLFVDSSDKRQFMVLLLFQAVLCVVFCGAALILMRNKPKIAPSPTGATPRDKFLPAVKACTKNFSFLMMCIVMAMSMGTLNIFLAVIQAIVDPYNFSSVDAGLMGLMMTLSGLFGSLVCSPIVARTRKYKLVSCIIMTLSAAGNFLFAFTLTVESLAVSLICIFLIGFGMMSISAFMMELACEVTYPVGEAMSTNLLIVGGQMIGVSGVYVVDALLFNPLLANLVLAICMGIAAIATFFIRETLVRTTKDREEALLDSPTEVPKETTNTKEVLLD